MMAKSSVPVTQLNVLVPASLRERLQAFAKRQEISMNAAAARLLGRALELEDRPRE